MRLKSLNLESFRSYKKLSLDLSGGSHLFLGQNGAGKTNLVEAISYLSQGRSCLRSEFDDAIAWGEDFFRIRAEIESDASGLSTLEYVFQRLPRRSSAHFINDVRTPLLQFLGALPTVTFLPQSLSLFTGAPADRRAFLDGLAIQLRPAFAGERMEYERVLKQRNALLKQIANGEVREDDLGLWDGKLADIGAEIVGERLALIKQLNESLQQTLHSLGETWSDVTMNYAATGGGDSASLLDALTHFRSRDLILQSTTVGPHRDDWSVVADGRDLSTFASRGQQRATLLSLLFVSAGLFRTVRGETPVVLLDDVLSELDAAHQNALLSHLSDAQVIITATHPTEEMKGLRTWKVGAGKVV